MIHNSQHIRAIICIADTISYIIEMYTDFFINTLTSSAAIKAATFIIIIIIIIIMITIIILIILENPLKTPVDPLFCLG